VAVGVEVTENFDVIRRVKEYTKPESCSHFELDMSKGLLPKP
jgi:hypothetical protein